MNSRFFTVLVLMLFCFVSCKQEVKTIPVSKESATTPTDAQKGTSIESLIDNLQNSRNQEIMVVAHRGDWRNAPENSLQAIENCIKMGVDMVEIDVRQTKDGQLILMHDETIDRTTTGTGKVTELTWDYLQTLQLRDGIGHETPHKIPTLEEALRLCKGKILVNLDKSYNIFAKCYEVVQDTGTEKQVIIKGAIPYQQVKDEFGEYLDKVYFMPIVRAKNPDSQAIVDEYLEYLKPVAFEFTVPQDTLQIVEYFDDIRAKGSSVWVNALWPHHNGGHDDERAAINPSVYDWFVENDIDIIQTDRPKLLLEYLRSRNLHN
ncbi:glycerophosphodiester phosphodiesterase family protein [Allomuricauda sp. SCSIO 65647]|uniref:glycerophosphodiester phosphodiesterase family protein n=1 Tax=Allomuricauda sp. SCSIO 65647 TaxID=2908843 RepID=UPI001F48B1B4|nr:glycerophosphodiester phosphodiesterase family protein [Muricauda sp. SCSIO 65647]UJH66954.1 glycerophosphodiester phosphodiesterase family protein [Muricauda sp. SCSIO 65647]